MRRAAPKGGRSGSRPAVRLRVPAGQLFLKTGTASPAQLASVADMVPLVSSTFVHVPGGSPTVQLPFSSAFGVPMTQRTRIVAGRNYKNELWVEVDVPFAGVLAEACRVSGVDTEVFSCAQQSRR